MAHKHTFIYILITIVALLLFLNILFEAVIIEDHDEPIIVTSVRNTEQIFINTLHNYGIKDEWIKRKKIRNSKYDSVSYKYFVSVPNEVTIPQILKDLVINSKTEKLLLSSTEERNDGTTTLELSYFGTVKLSAELDYNSSLKREYSKIAFILTDFIDIDLNLRQIIFNIQNPVGIMLPLSHESRELAEIIKNNKKDYFIELNDNSNSLEIELSDDTGVEKFDAGIKKIISFFNSPRIFFIDNNEVDYSINTMDLLKKKFEEKGRQVLFINGIKKLVGEDEYDLHSLVDFHLNGLSAGDQSIFLIDVEDYLSIQPEINSFLKRGNRIVFPSDLL